MSSFGEDNIVPLIPFDTSLKLRNPVCRNTFRAPAFPANASSLTAPATFNAGSVL